MMYNDTVLDCFFSPSHVGILDVNQPYVALGRIQQLNPSVLVDLYMQCDEIGQIRQMSFKARGNPYVIAALEWLCRLVEGKSIHQVAPLDYHLFIEQLAIPHKMYPVALQIAGVYKEVLQTMLNQYER